MTTHKCDHTHWEFQIEKYIEGEAISRSDWALRIKLHRTTVSIHMAVLIFIACLNLVMLYFLCCCFFFGPLQFIYCKMNSIELNSRHSNTSNISINCCTHCSLAEWMQIQMKHSILFDNWILLKCSADPALIPFHLKFISLFLIWAIT